MRLLRLTGLAPQQFGAADHYEATFLADGQPVEVVPQPPIDPNVVMGARLPSLPNYTLRVPDGTRDIRVNLLVRRFGPLASGQRMPSGEERYSYIRPVGESSEINYTPTAREIAAEDSLIVDPVAIPVFAERNWPAEDHISFDSAILMVLGGVAIGYLVGRSVT